MDFTLMIKLNLDENEIKEFERQLKLIWKQFQAIVPFVNGTIDVMDQRFNKMVSHSKEYFIAESQRIEDAYNRLGAYKEPMDELQLKAMYRLFHHNSPIAQQIYEKIRNALKSIKHLQKENHDFIEITEK